jgi:hypothetical protein
MRRLCLALVLSLSLWTPWYPEKRAFSGTTKQVEAKAIAEIKRLGAKVVGNPVRKVDLSDSKVTNAGLAHLKTLRDLEELDLARTDVTDAGLKHLQGLVKLRSLSLIGTKVTDRVKWTPCSRPKKCRP